MGRIIAYIYVFFGLHFSIAQINEIGVFIGGSNPVSDVGSDVFINPNKLAYGILYKWNAHKKVSPRIQFNKIMLFGKDADSGISGRESRGFRFENDLSEISLGVEYSFVDFDMSRRLESPIAPYIYMGVAYFWQDDLYYDLRRGTKNLTAIPTKVKNGNGDRVTSWGIPVGLGIKAKISHRFLIGLEAVTRFTFTKNLDGSFPQLESLEPYRIGNKSSNDWYTTLGLTITYTFGEYPCYCR